MDAIIDRNIHRSQNLRDRDDIARFIMYIIVAVFHHCIKELELVMVAETLMLLEAYVTNNLVK